MTLSSPNIVCKMTVESRTLLLSVLHDDKDMWRWKISFDDGMILDQGMMITRVAAQVAVQRAFERRMQRAGVVQEGFTGYRWTEIAG